LTGRQAVNGDAGTMERQAVIIETGSRQGGRQLRARRQAVYREAGTMERQVGSRGQKSIGDTRHEVDREAGIHH
jgi:hypothetical protein